MTREEVVRIMDKTWWEIDPDPTNTSQSKAWLAILTALEQAIPGLGGVIEGTHVVVPVKITEKQILAAAESHFGKRRVNGAPGGISMTVNGIDHTFPSAMRKMYRAMLSAAEGEGK